MFTGLIRAVGVLAERTPQAGDVRLRIGDAGEIIAGLELGASIAVNGACLTATTYTNDGFWADVSRETLDCTTLGDLAPGDPVNLEPALRPIDPLGGHLVSGHVDGIGRLVDQRPDGRSWRLRFEAPAELARYIAAKGSICVDGVSLTVNSVSGRLFEVNIIPHTRDRTVLGHYQLGRRVNLEVDLLARYLERLMQGQPSEGGVTEALLRQQGFVPQAGEE
ncbi:MAG: riboflavin synthase [Candidatus Macondimonas sp.]